MKTKRFLSLFMTLALCLSLAPGLPVPALAADPVTYLDPLDKGHPEKICSSYSEIDENTKALGNGWYVVTRYVECTRRIEVTGHANLILGASMNVEAGIHLPDSSACSLTIWVQKDRSGFLGVGNSEIVAESCAGIGGNSGEDGGALTINGGRVETYGGAYGAGVGGGDEGDGGTVTVNGGSLTAWGHEGSAGIGGGDYGNGGTLTVTGGNVLGWGSTRSETTGQASPGIGAGRPKTDGKHPRSSGTVIITGGEVQAIPGDAEKGAPGAQPIGVNLADADKNGNDGADRIIIGDGMVVYRTNDAANKVPGPERASACRTLSDVVIEPCEDHQYENSTCKYCGDKQEMPYVNAKGESQTAIAADRWNRVTPLTTELTGGWWAVPWNVTVSGRMEIKGHVNLILCDGAGLTAAEGVRLPDSSACSLTIWGQTGGSGRLSAGTPEAPAPGHCAGIGGGDGDNHEGGGTLTVNGGVITAAGGKWGAGIGGGNCGDGGKITINGGTVTANGGAEGAGIGGGDENSGGRVEITGGTVTATGGDRAAGIGGGNGEDGKDGYGGTVMISGGTVTATGGNRAAGIGGGNHGDACRSDSDKIVISGGSVTANGGAEWGAGIGGGNCGKGGTVEITGGTVEATGGAEGAGIGGGDEKSGGKVTVSGGQVTATGGSKAAGIGGGNEGEGGTVEITGGTVEAKAGDGTAQAIGHGDGKTASGDLSLYTGARVDAGDASPGQPAVKAKRADACRNNKWARIERCTNHEAEAGGGSPICKWCGKSLTVQYYDPLEKKEKTQVVFHEAVSGTWETGWYVAEGETQVDSRIEISGTVNLILRDHAELKALRGIHLTGENRLLIWAQSENRDTAGKLTIAAPDKYNAGIGGNDEEAGGEITVNGGTVTAQGGVLAAGIGSGAANIGSGLVNPGGAVTVNGGSVTATGGKWGAGIGGGYGNPGGVVTVNGGWITADGGQYAAGIGGGYLSPGGDVTVNGGTVTATGGQYAAAIGHGTLNRTEGTLLIHQNAKVTAGDASPGEPAAAANRADACRSSWARVEPCTDHVYQLGRCTYCGGKDPDFVSAITGSLKDETLRYSVTAPAGALVVAARYDGGRMTDVQTAALKGGDAGGAFTMKGSGTGYKLFLLDGDTRAPLCAAWSSGA